MIKYLFIILFCNALFGQTVTTYFSNSTIEVDDSMIFDSSGNLYGSNFWGTVVYKITPSGDFSNFITGVVSPNGIAIDSSGNFFLAEYGAGKINKYDSSGSFIESYAVTGLPSGLIKDFDSDDMIFTNVTDDSVNRLAPDGTITTIFQGAPLTDPVGLTFDDEGNLFVGNFTGRQIYRLSGGIEYIATIPDNGAASGDDALGFIVFAGGRIYTTNFGGHQIHSVNPYGIDDFEVFSGDEQGDDDGPIDEATFDTPNGIIYNASQNALYISEFSGDGNIRRIDDLVLGTADNLQPITLELVPNPASNKLLIFGDLNTTSNTISLAIYNTQGQLVYDQKISMRSMILNHTIWLESLTTGQYLLKISDGNEHLFSRSFIKK